MNIYQEILTWSEQRPMWQRDALRRLTQNDYIKAKDIEEIFELCKFEHGLCDETQLVADPLIEDHLPIDNNTGEVVTLSSIYDIDNVNALIPDQELKLSNIGLTVIYGDNASGKSGYARILKRACRARGSGELIRPNIFNVEQRNSLPSAKINYVVGSESKIFNWNEGSNSPSELSNISVFDSKSASVYLKDKNDVAYLPAGLDLLTKLAQICEAIGKEIREEQIKFSPQNYYFDEFKPDTEVGLFVHNLTSGTKTAVINDKSLWTDQDEQELNNLCRRLAELNAKDPRKKVLELSSKISRLNLLKTKVDSISHRLSQEVIEDVKKARNDVKIKLEAVKLTSEHIFKNEPLPNVGSGTWKELWEAARRYSETEAYPTKKYPVILEEARCVLCQQRLKPEAQKRLKDFESFIKQETQASLEKATLLYNEITRQIFILDINNQEDRATIDEIKSIDEDLGENVNSYLLIAKKKQNQIQKAIEGDSFRDIQFPDLLNSPKQEIDELISKQQKEKRETSDNNIDEKRQNLESSIDELKDKKQLNKRRGDIIKYVQYLQTIDKYGKAFRGADTTGITSKNTKLTKEVVLESMREKFNEELKELNLTSISVGLEPVGGIRGALHHKILLQNPAQDGVTVDSIASEGEHQSIAIAAFLTELSTANSKSGIVFDDPTSSLSHLGRETIAKRLVEEAKDRQVIIFTHEITFLLIIEEAAEKEGVDYIACQIRRVGSGPGFCEKGHPWDSMKAMKRVKFLKNKIPEVKQLYDSDNRDQYNKDIEWMYGKLREAWERAIEEVLFCGAIKRFSRKVETTKLTREFDFIEDDLARINEGMTKCSTYLPGHDSATELSVTIPEPDELEKDILGLENWIDDINKRRNHKNNFGK